jgi:Na+-translocating ferredoxin:NAD+ oxidoreductase RNF subunit RnfB
LEPGDKQRHFLLSSVPTSCSFCVPAGPEGLVEVRSKNPVRYTLEPVVVEGTMAVLSDDPYGMYYRVSDAQQAN